MPAELKDILQALPGIGLTGVLLCILWGSYKRIWVWGHQLQECKDQFAAERDGWKEEARRNAEMAQRSAELVKELMALKGPARRGGG